MTPPISIAEKDELVRRSTAECLDHGHVLIYLALDLSTALGTVAQLQLALRHPANVGVSAGHIRKMIGNYIHDSLRLFFKNLCTGCIFLLLFVRESSILRL
jgi:hypothetical protein